jgi:cytidylate kinase
LNDNFVLGIAGRMGSGKSVLVQELASKLRCQMSSFGDVVRDVAESRGLLITRSNLQSVGQELVEKQLEEFCQAVIDRAGEWKGSGQLVIDGFRHSQVVETVRRLIEPVPLYLIFVDAPEDARKTRLSEREPEYVQHPEYELHPTEQSVEELREAADLVLRGIELEQSGADSVIRWLTHGNR